MEPTNAPAVRQVPAAPGAPNDPDASSLGGDAQSGAARLLIGLIIGLAVILAASIARLTFLLLQQESIFVERAASSVALGAETSQGPLPLLAVMICLIFIALTIDILAHEGAHVLSGALVGFRFVSVRFGILTIRRTRRGLRLSLSLRHWSGGATIYYPITTSDLRLRYSASVAAGLMASLLLAYGTASILDAYIGRSSTTLSTPSPIVVLLLTAIAVFSLISCVENLIPITYRHLRTDGTRLLIMVIGGPRCERMLLLTLLYGYQQRGVPSRERPAWAILRLVELSWGTAEEQFALIYAYSWALDRRDFARAAFYIDRVMASHRKPGGPKATLAHEIAFFTARYHRRPDIARAWLARGQGDRFGSFMRPRAEAAILLAEGRIAEAADCSARGLAAWEQYIAISDHLYRLEERDLREMLAEARHATTGGVTTGD